MLILGGFWLGVLILGVMIPCTVYTTDVSLFFPLRSQCTALILRWELGRPDGDLDQGQHDGDWALLPRHGGRHR